ncbi:MAG: cyclodeaminase/cyclohydrolase family protein [Atopostipes sp.]|nr:cyclodeaminase/cyclohydrolase family protein [Atopostipes sp.]
MKDKTVLNWTQELASKEGKYTGGSAASVVAAISTSLARFIFNLQAGKEKYKEKEDQIQEGIKKANQLNQDLLELSEIDAEAFDPVLPLYKLPRDTEEEKKIREKKIDEGLMHASEPPFKMIVKMEETVDLYQQLIELELKGTIAQDITIGLNIAIAAIESAKISSMINVEGISNKELKTKKTEEVMNQYRKTLNKAEKLLKQS